MDRLRQDKVLPEAMTIRTRAALVAAEQVVLAQIQMGAVLEMRAMVVLA